MISKLIKYLYLVLFGLTPLLFSSHNSELFEVPKMYFVYFTFTLILGAHLHNYISGKYPLFRPHMLNVFLLFFWLSQVISTIFSIDPHTSIFGYYSRLNGGLVSLTVFFLLFLILSVYINNEFKKHIINTILFTGFFVALYGFLQHFGIDKHLWIQDVQTRVFSTLGQPNWLAAYLCILLPFSIYKFLNSSSKYGQATTLSLTLLFFITLLFTKSKTGLIAVSISLSLFFALYLFIKNQSSILVRALRAIPLAIIFLFFALAINNPIKDLVFPAPLKQSEEIRSDILITPSEDIRKIVWQGAFNLWQQFPLVGTGPETFAFAYYWTRPASHNLTSEWDFLYNKAHNEYLNYLATSGAIGFLAYSLLIIYFLFVIIKSTQKNSDFLLNLSILAAFISILINNLTGFSIVITSLYFFLLPVFVLPAYDPAPNSLTSSNFLKKILPLLITTIIIFKFSSLFVADLAYSQALKSDSSNQLNHADVQIKTAIFLNQDEPIYRSLHAQILAKNAIVAHDSSLTPEVQKIIDSSIIEINQAASMSPTNINILKEKAQVYYYLATIDINHYPKAIESLIKVTRLAPTDAKAFYTLGKFWDAIGNSDEALINYQQAIDLKSNYDHAYFSAAKILFEQKQYAKAKTYFDTVISIAPANTEAREYLTKIEKH